jgi:broad specificity phosphatase PhoE
MRASVDLSDLFDNAEPGGVVLCLVRHGQTSWNASGRFLGRSDLPLDEVGSGQVSALSSAVGGRFTAVYASPLRRARDTALALHAAPRVVEALAELDQGHLEGLDGPTAMARFPEFFAQWARDPATAVVPGGELLGALQRRVVHALGAIASAHRPGEVVGVVTHQLAIASTACAVAREPLARWREHRVGNAQMTVLWAGGDRWRILGERIDPLASASRGVAGA